MISASLQMTLWIDGSRLFRPILSIIPSPYTKQNSKQKAILLTIKEAIELQRKMAQQVIAEDCFRKIKWIGGMDVSNNLFDPTQSIYAAAVVLSKKECEVIDECAVKEKQEFPYRTGLLAFREAPALVHAYENLKQKPDLIMVDGQGICHPRGLGIASHLGVLLDIPTIGVAKTILVGEPKGSLEDKIGSRVPLYYGGRIVGALLRTRPHARPLVISIGHKISLETAIKIVLDCLRGYRLPEPTRQAHLAANTLRKSFQTA